MRHPKCVQTILTPRVQPALGALALLLPAAFACIVLPATAAAQTGVSDDRVSLPEGPGSFEGIGDDADVNPNMGQMSYSVPINVPAGHPGMAPSLMLAYSSGAGQSVAGMGWSLEMPGIERLTLRRVPRYDTTDEFVVGGEQLTRVVDESTTALTYRARFEGGFVRYRWHSAEATGSDYWTAEYPDGRIGYFGASADGTPVANARVGGAAGTFRYLLVEMTDVWGHRAVYTWGDYGTTALLEHVGWNFDGDSPAYEVELDYTAREDWTIDCSGGFEEINDQALREVTVTSRGTVLRRYELDYESYTTSGGFTRLEQVQMYGLDDTVYEARAAFEYSRTLGDVCADAQCERPFVNTFSNKTGVPFTNRTVTLVDINGDSLPDLVASDQLAQKHRIWTNTAHADGSQTLEGPVDSLVGEQTDFDFSDPYVQVLDANGDGFTDVMSAKKGLVLYNRGGGDWDEVVSVWDDGGTGGLPDLSADFDLTDGELNTLRFMDYDNDRKIDIIKSVGSGDSNLTTVYRNDGSGFTGEAVDAIGRGFEADTVELNDFNGDGLLDIVEVTESEVRYRLNLGYGTWSVGTESDWRVATGTFNFTTEQAEEAELEDMNGDGLADLVLVSGTTVRLWINENGRRFGSEQTIVQSMLSGGSIPDAGEQGTVVLFADMNGNGSSDVVWVDTSGEVSYLELYPVKPNLLSRVTNGLGRTIEVTYGTSVEHMARDVGTDNEWTHTIPFPNVVVDSMTIWDALHPDVQLVRRWQYHDGWYDGIEKQFRGFGVVEQLVDGDDLQESGEERMTFDLGTASPHMAGRMLTQEQLSAGRSLTRIEDTWDHCDLSAVEQPDDVDYAVRWACKVQRDAELREGAEATEWAQTRETWEYDGYGNVTRAINDGVVSIGDGACGACDRAEGEFGTPCGDLCLGDEMVVETEYVGPESTGGAWILGRPYRTRTWGDSAAFDYTEQLTFYDGQEFVGDAGQLTHGFVSRVSQRVSDDGTTIDVMRARRDEHGNTVEVLDPLATTDGSDHRRTYTWSDDGLRVEGVSVANLSPEGEPYTLERSIEYDTVQDLPVRATDWVVVQNDTAVTGTFETLYAYDAFGRLTKKAKPGDTLAAPTDSFEYTVGSPSKVVVSSRSVAGAEPDRVIVQCVDGYGRAYQTKERRSDGDWMASEMTVFTPLGAERERFQPYHTDDGECDAEPPVGVLSTTTRYDVAGRPLVLSLPSNSGEVTTELSYGPLETWIWDLNDTDPASPHYQTPTVRLQDGLGRPVAIGRTADTAGSVEWYTVTWTHTGFLRRMIDPNGNERLQDHDLLGRVLTVWDTDRGELNWGYDDAGNVVVTTDGTGTVRREYDGANRLVSQWVDGDDDATRVSWTWDFPGDCERCELSANQVVRVDYASPLGAGSDVSAFDSRSRLTWVGRTLGTVSLDLTMDWDNTGRLKSVAYPGGRTVSYTYDDADRVMSIAGYVDAIEEEERGLVSRIDFANGTSVSHTYDARTQLLSMDLEGASATLLGFDFERDTAGRVTAVTDRTGDGFDASASFTYDALDRVASATFADETVTYTWDAADNLTARTSTLAELSPVHDSERTFDPAAAHRLASWRGTPVTYDAAGRVTARGDLGLSWNGFGRLSSTTQGGETIAEHFYADDNDRILTRLDGDGWSFLFGPDFSIDDGVASIWVKLGDQSVARHEYAAATLVLSDVAPATGDETGLVAAGDGLITAADAWLAFASGQGLLSFETTDGAVSETNAMLRASAAQGLIDFDQRITWLHRDHVDNLVAVTDADGTVVERTATYPFGQTRASTSNGTETMHFGDKRAMAGGLVQVGVRDYDPLLATFTRPDELFESIDAPELDKPWEAGGAYIYALNNPMGGQDETGADLTEGEQIALNYVIPAFMARWRGGYQMNANAQVMQQAREAIAKAHNTSAEKVLDPDLDNFVWSKRKDIIAHLDSVNMEYHGTTVAQEAANMAKGLTEALTGYEDHLVRRQMVAAPVNFNDDQLGLGVGQDFADILQGVGAQGIADADFGSMLKNMQNAIDQLDVMSGIEMQNEYHAFQAQAQGGRGRIARSAIGANELVDGRDAGGGVAPNPADEGQ